jgi:hypothetical protein
VGGAEQRAGAGPPETGASRTTNTRPARTHALASKPSQVTPNRGLTPAAAPPPARGSPGAGCCRPSRRRRR